MATAAHDVLVRPMVAGDVDAAERLSDRSHLALDQRTFPRSWPDPEPRIPDRGEQWKRRTRHLLGTDPGGCWVAESDGAMVGIAVSLVRETTWILASYAVEPSEQGHGIGRQLLAAALHHGRACVRGMLSARPDPGVARRYRSAGFTLHPVMLLHGAVPREALPVLDRVRPGTEADRDLMDSVDRRARGAAHGPDHPLLLAEHRLIVVDHHSGAGYAYVDTRGTPVLLAATNRRTATDLLWESLAGSHPDVPLDIARITPANTWAVDVGLAARMELHQRGYLALRALKPPAPYLPHPTLM
jgi:GNAT superfamily N-acetyltransferase